MGDTVNNTAIGSALIIPDGLLNNLTKIDKKIKDIQDTSRATANVFNNSFASMSMGLKTGILTHLQEIINQLGNIGQAAATASSATQNMGSGLGTAAQGATNFGTSVTGVVEATNRMIGQLQQTGQVGSSSLMAAKLAADKLMVAMQFKYGQGNIAELKNSIRGINETLNDTERQLTRVEQQNLVELKRHLQEELKEAERTQNERAVNLQRVLDRMMRAEQSYQRQVQQNNKKTAEQYKSQNYASNTTYSGSLSFADNANTINRRTQAIKYLTEARNALSKTDADYINKLATLNAKIKELNAENRQAIASSQELNNSHRRLMDTAGQLQRAFALLFSVSQIRGYVNQIAKVRGEFELQQRSLEAILQNKTEADAIFNKTVALAVQSPFQIRELVSYTKQLAAYRIESDKLYDTTKRLADVSAGLGVDMSRLILAYGQVKAAAYLRGTEVRQFTEAGINLYGELQRYFQEVKGEAYTTAQIVDMISKRMVTFEDVEQIFKRITDQGGIFYRMQEIQAETLQGKIANFKDSVDVMMNEIGKDNEGLFKGAIDSATTLLGHWESVVNVGKTLVGVFILLKTQSMLTGVAMSKVFTAEFAAASTKNATALTLMKNGFASAGVAAKNFGLSLKTAFMINLPLIGITAAITAVISLFNWLNETKKAILEISKENGRLTSAYREIVNAYEAIGDASIKSGDKEKTSSEGVLKEKKTQLANLKKLYDDAGLKVPVAIERINDAEIDKEFNKFADGYERYLKVKKSLDIAYAENNSRLEWGGLLGDNIDKDSEDLTAAYESVISKTSELDEAMALLYDRYNSLTDAQKRMLDEANKRQKGQSEIDYLKQQSDGIEKISKSIGATLDGNIIKVREYNQNFRKAFLFSYKGSFEEAKSEFENEIKDIEERMKKRFSKKDWEKIGKIELNAALNTKAADEKWEDWKIKIVKQVLGINIKIDKKDAQKQINYLDDMIQKTIGDKTYKLNIAVSKTFFDTLADAVDDAGKIVDAAGTWNKIINSKGKVTWGYAKQDSEFEKWYRNTWRTSMKNTPISDMMELSDLTMKKYAEYRQKLAQATLDAYGLTSKGQDKSAKAAAKAAAKAQRDILSEQISLLKEMQKRYEDLQSVMGKNDAIQSVLQYYSASLQNVKMPESIVNSFVPTKEGLIKALEDLLKTIPQTADNFKKRMDVRNTIAELKVQIDKENLKTDLDKVKDEIEKAFNGLQLYKNLKDLGLSDVEVSKMFGNITKSFADVRKQIESDFTSKFGADQTKWGKDVADQYAEQMNKLDKQIYENSVSQFKELSKAYKDELDERLKIDLWYAEERKKIEENEQLTKNPALKDEFIRNLEKQRAQKSDEAVWKQFKNSDEYIKIFENLDYTSTATLDKIRKKLDGMKDSLKNLPPDQLKVIVELIEKLKGETLDRNPIKSIARAFKDLKNAKPEDKQQAIADLGAAFAAVAGKIDKFNSAFGEFSSMLSSFGVDVPEEISGALSGMSQAFSGAGEFATAYAKKDVIGMITGGMKTITGIGNTIGSIFSFGNKDKKLQKEIEKQQRIVERLERAYEKLKVSMDEAWSAANVIKANKDTKQNIEAQIKSYEKMIAAERGKKDSNSSLIEEWQNKIDDLKDALKELEEQTKEAFGGFGSEANYKSAAQEFADAWMDAFNETENTLDALNDTFENYFNNMLKKQLMQRAAQKYLQPIFDAFDKAVSEGNAGGNEGRDVTKEEIAEIQRLKDAQLKNFDEYAKALMEVLNIKPNGAKTELSKLQQGIQTITESTGKALESILNSIRFFVAQQTTDLSAIRVLLQQSSSIDISASTDTPMLTELRVQTTILRNINSNLEKVIRSSGHPKQGAGIKVFMD